MTDDIATLVRDATRVRNATPLDEVVARADRYRHRRLAGRAAMALTCVAGLTVGVLAVTSVGPGASPAWSVEQSGPDTVTVTITELHDPAGLQDALRAQGLQATVYYGPGGCRYEPGSVVPGVKAFTDGPEPGTVDVVVIHPAALAAGTGLLVMVDPRGDKIGGQPRVEIALYEGSSPLCSAAQSGPTGGSAKVETPASQAGKTPA